MWKSRIYSIISVAYLLCKICIVSTLKIEVVNPVRLNASTTITTTNTPESSTTPISTTLSPSTSTITTTIGITSTTPSTTSARPDDISNSTNVTAVKSQSGVQYGLESSYRCECDLKQHLCDINCCCDRDCTQDMKKAFICADLSSLHGPKYQQGLPSCKVNDGWLCIFKDNSKNEVHEYYNERIDTNRFHNWPNYFSMDVRSDNDRDHYVVGYHIMIYVKTSGEIKTIDLPYSLLNSHCHVMEPVRHLIDIEQTCTMSSVEFQNFYLSLLENTESYKLLRNRKGIINGGEHLIDKSYYFDFSVDVCDADADPYTCIRMNNDTIPSVENCWKLTLFIHHNFTELTGANISLVCSEEKQNQFITRKSINVRFIQTNETLSVESSVSGKYGYRIGNPVIVAQYIPVNDALDDNEKMLVISYFHDNATIRRSHQGIPLPKSVQGYCSEITSDRINYFENTFTQCFVTSNNGSILSPDSNFTQFCENLQRNAFHHLIGDKYFSGELDSYVSELGWPLNLTSHWIKAELRNFEFNKISGTYSQDTNSFQCANMLLSIRYEFITARISIQGTPHQNVIKKFVADFGNRVNLRFKLDEELKLPIYVYVRFYDATSSSIINNRNNIPNAMVVILLCFFI